MAEIRPFRGLRFNEKTVGNLASVMTPPYDVIDAAAQEQYYQRSPYSIIRVELGKQFENDSSQNNRYTRAATFLDQWLRTDVLRAEHAPAIYAYQQTFSYRGSSLTRTGFLAAMRLEEWDKRIVLPHEATMSGPKVDRLNLMRTTGANCSPIFTLYEDSSGVARETLAQIVSDKPIISLFDEDGVHRLWAVTDDRLIGPLRGALEAVPVYIADGHHRYETALHYRDEQRRAVLGYSGNEAWNFVMTLLVEVDDPGLTVLPTHRLINPRRLEVQASSEGALTDYFGIAPLSAPDIRSGGLAEFLGQLAQRGESGHVFGIYGLPGSRFAFLTPRSADTVAGLLPSSRAAAWRQLDVSVLTELLLRRVFDLAEDDFEDETRVTYTRDEEAAVKAVDDGRYRLAVFLNPTAIRQVLEVARAGEVMPHKSTYFHPKPLTGMVLNRLTEVLV